jgi:hypothetical protein
MTLPDGYVPVAIPKISVDMARSVHITLPESKALPSVEIFAECLLSGTRQRRLCRVPHSVKPYSRQRGSVPSAGHSAQADTRQRLVCRVSTLGKGGSRQRVFFAECHTSSSRQRPLCRVSSLDTRQSIFLFF